MHRYMVTAHVTISMSTDVLADSEDEAVRVAEGRGMQSLCWACAGGQVHRGMEWVTSGELDGEPEIVDVERLDDE